MVRVRALRTIRHHRNTFHAGEEFEVEERTAKLLVRWGDVVLVRERINGSPFLNFEHR